MKHLMLHFSRGGTHGSSDRIGAMAWENVVEYLTFHGKVLWYGWCLSYTTQLSQLLHHRNRVIGRANFN